VLQQEPLAPVLDELAEAVLNQLVAPPLVLEPDGNAAVIALPLVLDPVAAESLGAPPPAIFIVQLLNQGPEALVVQEEAPRVEALADSLVTARSQGSDSSGEVSSVPQAALVQRPRVAGEIADSDSDGDWYRGCSYDMAYNFKYRGQLQTDAKYKEKYEHVGVVTR
jgi:hypothetical protein